MESLPELLTSDSEGSYAGVGSPRDLQSPDFIAGFHLDKVEVSMIKHCFLNTMLDVPAFYLYFHYILSHFLILPWC